MRRSQNGGRLNFFICVFELRWVEAAVRGWGSSGGGGGLRGGWASLTDVCLQHRLAAPQLSADRRRGWTNHSRGLGEGVLGHVTPDGFKRHQTPFGF